MTTGSWRPILTALAATVIVCTETGAVRQGPNLSRDPMVAAAAAYVRSYQQQFAFLIADERTVQESFGVKGEAHIPLGRRTTRGEIFITFLEGRRHWTAVRDVAEVDGIAVLDRVNLPDLLSREDPDTVARRLFALNARYNIGGVVRNFNDPMLALLPLSDAHRSRFSFDVERADRRDGRAPQVTLAFRERERPTLVRPESGGAAFARGALTIDAGTGTVRHARFTVRYDTIEAELVTEFTREDRLDLWVPSTFSERYMNRVDGIDDLITSTSTYSNYRRFEARGRLLESRPAP